MNWASSLFLDLTPKFFIRAVPCYLACVTGGIFTLFQVPSVRSCSLIEKIGFSYIFYESFRRLGVLRAIMLNYYYYYKGTFLCLVYL